MKYNIWGDDFPAVTFTLEQGERIYTQSGGMSWMTDGIQMETNMRGGFGKGIGRMLSGDSLFMANFTAVQPNQEITVAASMPGQIKIFELKSGYEIIAQKGAFMAATPGIEFSAHVTKSVMGGLFGGEGFILQKYSGTGLVFCEIDGSVKEINLMPGEKLKVDSGNVAAFEATVGYSAETVKGFKNVLFGGEGLFVTTLTGPGKVWLQTLTTAGLAARLAVFSSSGNK